MSERAHEGWLGFEHDGPALRSRSPTASGKGSGRRSSWPALGLALALARRRPADLVLASFALAYFATLLPLDAHFDRYVLPLVPVLGALAGSLRALVPVTLLLLVVPLDVVDPGHARADPAGHARGGAGVDRATACRPRRALAADPSAPPFDRRSPAVRAARAVAGARPAAGRGSSFAPSGIDYVVVSGRRRRPGARGRRRVPARGRASTTSWSDGRAGCSGTTPATTTRAPGSPSTASDGQATLVSVRAPCVLVLGAVLLAVAAGCSGSESEESSAATPKPKAAPTCPRQVARRLAAAREPGRGARLLPDLDAEPARRRDRRASGTTARPSSKDRSYLVSFLWHEAGNDVHVNFRGYPGRTTIPRCEDTQTVNGKTHGAARFPASATPGDTRLVGRLATTVYTVNRDADQWHVLYAWRRRGSLYTLSEHVAPPFTLGRVVRNLERISSDAPRSSSRPK